MPRWSWYVLVVVVAPMFAMGFTGSTVVALVVGWLALCLSLSHAALYPRRQP